MMMLGDSPKDDICCYCHAPLLHNNFFIAYQRHRFLAVNGQSGNDMSVWSLPQSPALWGYLFQLARSIVWDRLSNSLCTVCSLVCFPFRLIWFAGFMRAHLLVLQSFAMVTQSGDGQSVLKVIKVSSRSAAIIFSSSNSVWSIYANCWRTLATPCKLTFYLAAIIATIYLFICKWRLLANGRSLVCFISRSCSCWRRLMHQMILRSALLALGSAAVHIMQHSPLPPHFGDVFICINDNCFAITHRQLFPLAPGYLRECVTLRCFLFEVQSAIPPSLKLY